MNKTDSKLLKTIDKSIQSVNELLNTKINELSASDIKTLADSIILLMNERQNFIDKCEVIKVTSDKNKLNQQYTPELINEWKFGEQGGE